MLEMINFVFPISASMASSSRWESYCDSADDGCLENVTDLWMKISSPLSGLEDGPYELWCYSECRGSWISVCALTPVSPPL